ncbi:glycosyltransferase family 4 protein [Candidatus Beckwithbacteria bacterium]|nr:glycosyltransferase family 4 protein [Candidatus Beckwithbacteria bacterium]
MTKVLFIAPILTFPYAGGPEMSAHNAIKALNKISELHIITTMPLAKMGGNQAFQYYGKISKQLDFTPIAQEQNFLENYFIKKIRKYFFTKGKKNEADDVRYIIKYYDQNNIDIIWSDRHEFSYNLIFEIKKLRPNIKIVCDTAAVHSQFILREIPFQKDKSKIKKIKKSGKEYENYEKKLVNIADVTTAVSEIDASIFKSWTKHKERIFVFPNVVDLENYKKIKTSNTIKTPSLLIAGTFYEQSPMEHGTRWFLNNVLPKVRKEFPEIFVYIIGKGSDWILRDIADPKIIITGKVDSVSPYLHNTSIGLVPLHFESGTRFKILEYGTASLPTVSTSLGAEGLNLGKNVSILIEDNPIKFAQVIINLLKNKALRIKMGKNLYKVVKKNYSIDSLASSGSKIIKYLMSQ